MIRIPIIEVEPEPFEAITQPAWWSDFRRACDDFGGYQKMLDEYGARSEIDKRGYIAALTFEDDRMATAFLLRWA